MRAHRGPRAAVRVQPQDARETLEVVVDQCVVQLLGGLFARCGHDAVLRQEGEFRAAGRGGQGRRVHAQSSQIAHDEARGRRCRTRDAQEHVLRVRFEGNPVVQQRRNHTRHKEAQISCARISQPASGLVQAQESLLMKELEPLFFCVQAENVLHDGDTRWQTRMTRL